jgi:hypothetical protein
MKTKKLFTTAILIVATLFITSCSNNDSPTTGETSQTNFSMTDAPIDNANVKGMFITVADIKVDGVSIQNFSKTTIDLMQYQKGLTKLMGSLDLQTNSNSSISLILDNTTDASGNAPGCYVLMADGTVNAVQTASNEIDINDSFDVLSSTTNDIILDFDIRKSLVSDTSGNFKFVTMNELSNSIRVVNKANTGVVSGTASDSQNTSDKIIVYAYKKGTFNANTETTEQGSGVTFANAVTSCEVNKTSGNYELNFLNKGDYELHFASYKDTNSDGKFEFNGMLTANSALGIDLNSINITSNASLTIAVNLTAS